MTGTTSRHLLLMLLSSSSVLDAFVPTTTAPRSQHQQQQQQHWMASTSTSSDATSSTDPLGLPPELRRITDAFAAIEDDKLRYKQMMFMANELPPIAPEKMIPENKVPGCLSTVHVDAQPKPDGGLEFFGDSDGILTKGLVALLIRGINGCTADQIEKIDPKFVQEAKITESLTPGRNNGFLNMLATLKKKARQAQGGDKAKGPIYQAIAAKLNALQPSHLILEDHSYKHKGHAETKNLKNAESHFYLEIVTPFFDGMPLVKRHQLVYTLLGDDIMSEIHALQISLAKTPNEYAEMQ